MGPHDDTVVLPCPPEGCRTTFCQAKALVSAKRISKRNKIKRVKFQKFSLSVFAKLQEIAKTKTEITEQPERKDVRGKIGTAEEGGDE